MEIKETKKSESKNSEQNNKLSMPSAIIVAGLLIAGGLFFGLNSKNSTGPQDTKQQPERPQQHQQPGKQDVDIAKVDTNGSPFIGNIDAPVTIAYWSDYQCSFCKRFYEDTLSQTIRDYVDTGKVKIVFKDFQFLGPGSEMAGIVGRAVWEISPDKYGVWHENVYKNQSGKNPGWQSKEDLLLMAKNLNIDDIKIGQLILTKGDQYKQMIEVDKLEGASFGVKGTPGTIIGNNLIVGAQPYLSVKQLIDIELQGK